MSYPADHPDTGSAFGPYGAADGYVHDELSAGERIGPPLRRHRGRTLLRAAILLALVGGGAWYWQSGQPLPSWTTVQETASALASRIMPSSSEPTVRAAAATPRPMPVLPPIAAAVEPRPAPVIAAVAPSPPAKPEAPLATAALPAPAAAPEAPAAAEPLPPPKPDPADPYQVRAASIGLHPDISRAVLSRLSDTDYRHAAYAIEQALAKTADTEVFVWPKQRKPELALFQVKFVRGAAPNCRRYVVTITKDGWLTTALPMERCGAQYAARRQG